MAIIKNQRVPGEIVLRLNATDGTLTPNTANATAAEVVSGLNINSVMWSGQWNISRGANTVLDLTGNGSWEFDRNEISLREWNTTPIVCTLTGSGSIVLTAKKEY